MNELNSESNSSGADAWPWPEIPPPEWDAILPFAASPATPQGCGVVSGNLIQTVDFGTRLYPVRRIVVLKLDHFGDFIIGLPALRALRDAFPEAVIRLVCGKWNERSALASGLVDEVRCYNFFPERPQGVSVEPDALREFDAAVEGRYDVAIDLRVDEDTRHLLGRIDARLRCGIGSVFQFPQLDIALPYEHTLRANVGSQVGRILFLSPDRFDSSLPLKLPLHQFGPLGCGDIIHGPYAELPSGRLRAEIGLTVRGHVPGLRPASIVIEVVRNGGQIVARRVFGRRAVFKLRRQPVAFEFENSGQGSRFQFRVRVEGRPARGTVQFSGVTVYQLEAAVMPRYRPAELHIGEKLSLLVSLVRERTADLYQPMERHLVHPANSARRADLAPGHLRIAVAPFSNSTTRNWPVAYYTTLISLLLERLPCEVLVLGTPGQMAEAREITRAVQSPLLTDLVGRTTWQQLQDVLLDADLVICNNSGIGHLAAALGVKVLAIYSGSHQPLEWGPRGRSARTIIHPTPCSPCGFERLVECTAGHACMREITPVYVLSQVQAMLAAQDVPPI